MLTRFFGLFMAVFVAVLAVPLAWSGEQQLAGHRFQVAEGFTVDRVAGPPLVDRPISADFDETGALYVADSAGTNAPLAQQIKDPRHRVVRLVDQDRDGTFDVSTLFADRLPFPEGCMWLDGSLYVAAPPSIFRLTDVDGDGVADRREEWFQGTSMGHCGNDLHGPYLGLDGWVYWCKGAWAKQTYQRSGREPFVTTAAHIFRAPPTAPLDPQTGSIRTEFIEPVMTGGMDNPVDVTFTPNGERIFTTTFLVNPGGGLRDGLIHALYGGVYGKPKLDSLTGHPRTGPLLPPLFHMGAAAPCGLTCLRSDAWGKAYQGNLFACQFNTRKVTRHPLTQQNATYTTSSEDFLVSDQVDFHPTDVIEDADGSLIVVDTGGWYKLCCPTSQMEKPDVFGAIYRVRAVEAKKHTDPRGTTINFGNAAVKELIELLGDSRIVVAQRAMAALAKRSGDESVIVGLSDLFAPPASSSNQRSIQSRRNALWTLARIQTAEARAATRLGLTDSDPTNRQVALHVIALWRDRGAVDQVLALLEKDTDPHSQRVAFEALGRMGDPASVRGLLKRAPTVNTRELEHSLAYALIEIGDVDSLRAVSATERAAKRISLIALDQIPGMHLRADQVIPLLHDVDIPLRETASWIVEHHPDWAAELVTYLRGELDRCDPQAKNPLSDERRSELQRQLALLASAEPISDLLAQIVGDREQSLEMVQVAVRSMEQTNQPMCPDAWRVAILERLKSVNPESRLASNMIGVLRRWPLKHLAEGMDFSPLLRLSDDETLPLDLRLQALVAYPGQLRDDRESLARLVTVALHRNESVSRRSLAIEALSKVRWTEQQWEILLTAVRELSPVDAEGFWKGTERIDSGPFLVRVFTEFLNSPARSALRPEMVRDRVDQLDPSCRAAAERLLARLIADRAEQQSRLDELMRELPVGDIRRGQLVFQQQKTACVACHAIGYAGGRVGPDLTQIGKIRQKLDLLEAIVFPSASLVRSYEPLTVLTSDGVSHNGLLVEENSQSITLAISADKQVRVPLKEVEERKPSSVSIMPAGLDRQLSLQELADLLAFLMDRK
jgi:putative membrane-bound dehydrogenase-like protein